jgi:hypothetical protein
MEERFTFKDSIYLIADGEKLDLHNNYNFVGLEYSIEHRVLVLRWRCDHGDLASLDSPSEIELEYRDVTRFEFRPRDPEMPFTEDDCLWNAGYWREAGWPVGVWSGCLESGVFSTDAVPEEDWFRAFQFHSGAVVVVRAGEAHAKIRIANKPAHPTADNVPI